MNYRISHKLFTVFLLFLGLTLNFFLSRAQGYEIKVSIPALKDSTLILGHYFAKPNSLYADDTVKLNKKGIGVFKGSSALTGGMYVILLPSKRYFDLLIGDHQVFSVSADTTNFINTVRFSGSPDNVLFYDYQKFMTNRNDSAGKIGKKLKKTTDTREKDSLTACINVIHEEVKKHIRKLLTDNSKLFFATWLKTFEEVDIPDPPRDASGKITDSSFQYRYYKQHYFDNFDFTDVRLLRTPFYEQKILTYVDKEVVPLNDTINKEVDMLLTKTQSNKELFRYMLGTLAYHYESSKIMGQDAVFAYIAEKWYLPYATWIDETTKAKLKKEVDKIKPNILGKTAPNLKLIELPSDHFMVAKVDTAAKSNPYVGNPVNSNEIKAKYLVMVFWESDCGHCRHAIPLLYDSVYPRLKDKGVQFLAIHMVASVEGKRKWIDFVNDHLAYDWINAWSPYSYEFMDLYNVSSKPTIYILNENKKIIAKRIGAEQIEDIINFEENKNKIKQENETKHN